MIYLYIFRDTADECPSTSTSSGIAWGRSQSRGQSRRGGATAAGELRQILILPTLTHPDSSDCYNYSTKRVYSKFGHGMNNFGLYLLLLSHFSFFNKPLLLYFVLYIFLYLLYFHSSLVFSSSVCTLWSLTFKDIRRCVPIAGRSYSSASLVRSTPGYWRRGYGR